MNKKIVCVIFTISFLLLQSLFVYAQQDDFTNSTDDYSKDLNEIYEEQFDASGIKDLFDIMPSQAKKYFESNGIASMEYNTFREFNFFNFFKSFWDSAKIQFTRPLKLLFVLLGIILLTALINSFKTNMSDASYMNTYNVVSVLSVCGVMVAPITGIILEASATVKDVSNFILMFLPVFIGVIIASGKTLTGVAYNTFLFGTVQVISQISSTLLVPLLGIYLSFCICGSVSNYIKIDAITSFVKRTVIFAMGILLTVFVGLLTLQGLVTTSADTVGAKAAKFALSSFVPVIGGALSEAFNSIQGCISFIKSTVGVFGILVFILTFVPLILSILFFIFSINISCTVAEILNIERIPTILRACASTLSLMLAIVICFAVLFIVSTTVMLILGMNMI